MSRSGEDWSTLDRFQRTRGVLRLMAIVVHVLWAGQDQSPVILPASVPLSDSAVVAELTRNLEDNWKPIIDADVDRPGSMSRALDDQYKDLGRYGATRRVARCVFLGSAPRSGSPNQGIDAARVRLGSVMPGETVAIYGDALSRLADRATYSTSAAAGTGTARSRVSPTWPMTGPSASSPEPATRCTTPLEPDSELLESHHDQFAAVHAVPAVPADVADDPSARLVILGPGTPHRPRAGETATLQLAREILDHRGVAPRDFRNMLVFLAADDRAVADLEQAEATTWLGRRS
ncbi:MAG: hypothetical protein M3066_10050 [Actinomycetota bacterium]|nr:hypothetical protein [Actinomycetota bacterium]